MNIQDLENLYYDEINQDSPEAIEARWLEVWWSQENIF